MILLTGSSGKLGTELQTMGTFFCPSHEVMDITDPWNWPDVDMIVHAAGYTDVVGAETNKQKCFDLNVKGTLNLVEHYSKTPFVFISSEYAHAPVNFYALTKSLAEQIVTTHPNHLIIRTLFKPRPFPFPSAFVDQHTRGDYVDVIAERIMKEITEWDFKSKLIYVGTKRKTIYELAKETNPAVGKMSVKDVKGVVLPTDYL